MVHRRHMQAYERTRRDLANFSHEYKSVQCTSLWQLGTLCSSLPMAASIMRITLSRWPCPCPRATCRSQAGMEKRNPRKMVTCKETGQHLAAYGRACVPTIAGIATMLLRMASWPENSCVRT